MTTGYPDGTFRPDNEVTRAEMAAFLSRAFLGMP
ncbi:MAG: S-layer homology domain-containing protein [Candidatus Mariimomonas ferrooxydans]